MAQAKKKPTKSPRKKSTKPAVKAESVKSAKKQIKTDASKAVKKPAKAAKTAKATSKARAAKPKRRWQKPLLTAAGVLVLAAGVFAANYNNSANPVPDNPEAANVAEAKAFSDSIIEHLRKGECEEIAAKTSEGFQAVIAEETWLQQCNIASGVLTGTASSYELADTNLEDDITEFSYRIRATDDQTYVITTQLVNRDNTWQLQGINSQVEAALTP